MANRRLRRTPQIGVDRCIGTPWFPSDERQHQHSSGNVGARWNFVHGCRAFHVPMRTIMLEVDSVPVAGEIMTWSERHVEARLVRPFGGLSDGRHIMLAALPYVRFDERRADAVARDVIAHLFAIGRYVHDHIDELREAWRPFRDAVARLVAVEHRIGDMPTVRRRSRDLLRRGTITRFEHQRVLRATRDQLEEIRLAKQQLRDMFWESQVPLSGSVSVRDQVIKSLDREW